MDISVIVFVKNNEEYIQRCLDSIFNQSVKNIEVIIINADSNDKIKHRINEFKKLHINLILINNEEEISKSKLIYKALSISNGKYVYFLENNCYLNKNALEICFEECEKYKLDIVTFDLNKIKHLDYIETYLEEETRKNFIKNNIQTGEEFIIVSDKEKCITTEMSTNFYNKKFMLNNINNHKEDFLYEDIIMYFYFYVKAKKIKYIPHTLVNIFMKNTNYKNFIASITNIDNNINILNVINSILDKNIENMNSEVKQILLKYSKSFVEESIIMCDILNDNVKRKEVIKKSLIFTNFIDIDMQIKKRQLSYKKLNKTDNDNIYIRKMYYKNFGKLPNEQEPKTFAEKIHIIKISDWLEDKNVYLDKYRVRKFIANKVGEEYLVKLLGVYTNSDMIDFDLLPSKFVLKLNNGSGCNLIVNNKNQLNYKDTRKLMDEWMNKDFISPTREKQARNVKQLIICEAYLENEKDDLYDYKFFCFDGKCKFIQVDRGRVNNHIQTFYDTSWKKIDMNYICPKNKIVEKKPNNYDEMLNIAEKLSTDFPFVRVDLYNINGKIYFGELTFTPCNGMANIKPYSKDLEIGSLIDLDKLNRIKK